MNSLYKWLVQKRFAKDHSNIHLPAFFLLFVLILQGFHTSDYHVAFFRNARMHTSKIVSVGSDHGGKYILTSSADYSARLWDASNGELLNTFLMPDGKDAQLYASISPSGNLIALGADELLVFNAETGRLLFREKLPDNHVKALSFSYNSDLLAVSHSAGIQIYETSSWNPLKKIPPDNSAFTALAFDKFGWLACLSAGGIRLYDNEFNMNRFLFFEHQHKPASLAISPDGTAIVAGFYDENPKVYDAGTLEIIARPETTPTASFSGHFSRLAFSADGHYLLAAGNSRVAPYNNDPENKHSDIHRSDVVIGRWSHKGKGEFRAIPAGYSNISAIVSLPDGGFVYANEQPELVRTGPAYERIFVRTSKANTFQTGNESMLKVNTNADEILVQFKNMPALVFSLKAKPVGYLSEVPSRTRFRPARQITSGIKLDSWKNSDSVFMNNKLITWLEGSDRIRSADIADHGLRFILGSDRNIYCAARDGTLLWKTPVTSEVLFVNISGNARVVVVALKDGSIRWFRMSDGELLLNLFTYDREQLWALCTASGFYDHSQGAENLCGVMIHDPVNGSMLFAPLSAASETHHTPDLAAQLIIDWDEEKALERLGISATGLREVIMGDNVVPALTKPRYCLIVGSYLKQAMAGERQVQLGREGYPDVEIIQAGNNFRICIARFLLFSEADKIRKDLEDQFPGIWIMDLEKP